VAAPKSSGDIVTSSVELLWLKTCGLRSSAMPLRTAARLAKVTRCEKPGAYRLSRTSSLAGAPPSFSLLVLETVAIRGHKQIKVTHVSVVCGKKNTKVPGNAGENQSSSLKVAKQRVESGNVLV